MKRFNRIALVALLGIMLFSAPANAAEVSLYVQGGTLYSGALGSEGVPLPGGYAELTLGKEGSALVVQGVDGTVVCRLEDADGCTLGSGLERVIVQSSLGYTPVHVGSGASLLWLTVESYGPVNVEGAVDLLHVNGAAAVSVGGWVNQLYVTSPNASAYVYGTVHEAYITEGVVLEGMEPTDVYNQNMTKTINLILGNGQYVQGHR